MIFAHVRRFNEKKAQFCANSPTFFIVFANFFQRRHKIYHSGQKSTRIQRKIALRDDFSQPRFNLCRSWKKKWKKLEKFPEISAKLRFRQKTCGNAPKQHLASGRLNNARRFDQFSKVDKTVWVLGYSGLAAIEIQALTVLSPLKQFRLRRWRKAERGRGLPLVCSLFNVRFGNDVFLVVLILQQSSSSGLVFRMFKIDAHVLENHPVHHCCAFRKCRQFPGAIVPEK